MVFRLISIGIALPFDDKNCIPVYSRSVTLDKLGFVKEKFISIGGFFIQVSKLVIWG